MMLPFPQPQALSSLARLCGGHRRAVGSVRARDPWGGAADCPA